MATKKTTARKVTTKTTKPKRAVKKTPVRNKVSQKTEVVLATEITQISPKKKQLNKTAAGVGIIVIILILLYIFRSSFVVAFVNGQPILRSEFNSQMEKDAGKQAMNEIITNDLIFQDAQQKHISVNPKDIQSELNSINLTLKAQGQTLDQALAAKNLTRSDLENQIRIKLIVDKILGPQIKVSDQEVSDYITNNKDTLPTNQTDEQLKTGVKARLMQDKLSQKFQDYITALQKKAKINYLINIGS